MIRRIIVRSDKESDFYKIYNLEILDSKLPNTLRVAKVLNNLLCNSETEMVVREEMLTMGMPAGDFIEVMYHNGVIDPAQESIITACQSLGIPVLAAKISYRYYGERKKDVVINKLVHAVFTEKPVLTTLLPQGERKGMRFFDLAVLSDKELSELSKTKELALSLAQMKRLQEIQEIQKLALVNDVFLETFAARWSNHCDHSTWKALGLFKILKEATEKIANNNLVSAFVDNAGGWKFYDGQVIVFKLETHNSPTQKEPYGGQTTKLGGVLRDIFEFGLGALPIGNLEMTTVGEFDREKYPSLKDFTLSAGTIAKETVRAIAEYGNPMGVPMLLARMTSHPDFSGKVFALGGSFGLTTEEAATKGRPRIGDYVVLVGGKTGNDGLHGATVSSGELTEKTDQGGSCHVQIGNPFVEQKMMRAGMGIRDRDCASARNDFGAGGIISAFGEMGELVEEKVGESVEEKSGVLINLALVPLKCAGLENWQIALSESQERFAHAIKPEKLAEAMEIYARYELEATVIGVFTGNGNLQLVYDPELKEFTADTPLSGEIALDIPYELLKDNPLPKLEVIKPPSRNFGFSTEINSGNVEEMALRVVGHFDCCNQSIAVKQYDSTVQGKTFWGPLYGKKYNINSHLAVSQPMYGEKYGMCVSQSFSPWQFAVNARQAAVNAMLDTIATQVVAGVKLKDICLADNFYTPNKDPYAYWRLKEQVKAIAALSVELGTPFITGKDSSHGSVTFGGLTINVPPSACITAMGKIKDVDCLVPPIWQSPGNLLFVLGPRVKSLGGSILASSLGTDDWLEEIHIGGARWYFERLYELASLRIFESAVPINRGGIMLRLFEGVEASGLGVETELMEELFPESFGAVLVEVRAEEVCDLRNNFPKEWIMPVGVITQNKDIKVQGIVLKSCRLYEAWNNKFRKEVYKK